MEYTVSWVIDIDADSPVAAARKALEIQRNESIAHVFTIDGIDIDLDAIDEDLRQTRLG